ncbi:hypothetical protein ACEPAF_1216 [Sanghuangporus sanghuang]
MVKTRDSTADFDFPIRVLESERVLLTVFDPSIHAREFVDRSKAHPKLFKYFPCGPFEDVNHFTKTFYEEGIIPKGENILFAIFDKTGSDGSPRFAGIIGLLWASVVNQYTEIRFVIVLPEFQRTHVTTNAVGLLLHYCLELPNSTKSKYGPGLGLRRVQWQAHGDNAASLGAAERMGFRREGLLRWQRIWPEGRREAVPVSPERAVLCKSSGGIHAWMLAVCWDDWDLEGTREFVQERMERV